MKTKTNTKKAILENSKNLYTVIAFNRNLDFRRESTYAGLNMLQAINEIKLKQSLGYFCLLFDHGKYAELDAMVSRDLNDYLKFR